jgi:hypothetical protein
MKRTCDEREESMMSITSNVMFSPLDIDIKILEFEVLTAVTMESNCIF